MIWPFVAAFAWGWVVGLLTADWVAERTRRKYVVAQDESQRGGMVTW